MIRAIRRVAFYAAIVASLAGHAGSANARLTEDDAFELRFGGFHLGMSRSEVDRVIALRTDIAEPQSYEMGSFDCAYLRPKSEKVELPDAFTSPRGISFEAANARSHGVRFGRRPDEDRVSYVLYREGRGTAAWPTYLDELEARFGKADVTGETRDGHPVALWCTADKDCRISDHDPRAPRLSVRLLPYSAMRSYPGDFLDFELHEGTDRSDQRRRFYEALQEVDPAQALLLYDQCRSPVGKFGSEDEAERYYISLMSMGSGAAKILWNVEDVPTPVLSALGMARGESFGPGVCFAAMDVFIKNPRCKSYSMVRFRWARQIGDLWLVSLGYGGVSLRSEYSAIRMEGDGNPQKVWWDESLEGFNAWQTSGAAPMAEPDER